ncbi:MAG: hypothetical protein ACKVS7_13415 [Gemmatimonadaceae bacterium]
MRRLVLAAGLTMLLAAPAAAQMPLADIRVGVTGALPTGDLADAFSSGFGAYARVGVPVGVAKIMGTATFTRLNGKDVTVPGVGTFGVDDENVIGLTVGPHFSPAPLFDFGIEGGYFTNIDKLGLVPSVSLGLAKFDLMASYTVVFSEDVNSTWISIGAGLRF